jgi:SAM-dependent methyltransferase
VLTAAELAPLLVECSEHGGVFSERDLLRREAPLNAERCLAIAELAGHPRRVLEVGPGNLVLTTAFRAIFGENVELSAVEHPEAPNREQAEFRERLARQKVELRTADLLTDPLPFDGGFDAVLFCGTIEHLEPTKVRGLLERLRDQLADDGRLVIFSTNLAAFVRIASLAFGKGDVMEPPVRQGWGQGHIRLYTRSDMEVLIDRAGMRMAEWRYLNCERVYIGRAGLRGKLLYAGQVAAPMLVRHMATSWVSSAVRGGGQTA